MTDFLILYESRSREIENCALLSTELELRGYKVKIKSILSPYKYFVNSKVLVVPHLYQEEQLNNFGGNMWHGNKKIVDLQYEQILSKGITSDDVHNPKGQAKFAHHIAWGEDQARRFINCGVPPHNIHTTGSMSMDLMRNEFTDYFLTRDEVAAKFNLSKKKEWVLFVSSFSYANKTEAELRGLEIMNPTTRMFNKLSDDTLEIIIDWLKRGADKYKDKMFIYRPHPAERISDKVKEIEEQFNNFRIISDLSMRQWAKSADKIYNWYSTSIADIYFAKKSCYIVRPIEIPENKEVAILDGAEKLTTYKEFENSIENVNDSFPVSQAKMEFYYGNQSGTMAYQRIADLCENLLNNNVKGYDFHYTTNSENSLIANFKRIKGWLNLPFYTFCRAFCVTNVYWPFNRKQSRVRKYKKDIYGVEKEIAAYKNRLRPIVEKIHQQYYVK